MNTHAMFSDENITHYRKSNKSNIHIRVKNILYYEL